MLLKCSIFEFFLLFVNIVVFDGRKFHVLYQCDSVEETFTIVA